MPSITTPAKYLAVQRSTYTDTIPPGTVWTFVNQPGQLVSFGDGNDTLTRNSNPSWRLQIAKRQDASTGYVRAEHKIRVPVVECETQQKPGAIRGSNYARWSGFTVAAWSNVDDSALSDLALTRLKRKLKTQIGSIDAIAPIGELREVRQTISGMAAIATQLVGTLADIKKTRGVSAYKYAASAWLTFNFGLAPMISDFNKACKAVSSFLERKDSTVRITSSAFRDWKTGPTNLNVTGARGAGMYAYSDIHHTLSYKYIASFNLPLKSSNNYDISDHFGLGFPELVPALWELTAFSWLADYFGTIGSYLDDTFTSPPGNVQWAIQNKKYLADWTTSITHKPDAGFIIIRLKNGTAFGSYFQFVRTALGASLPRLALRFKSTDEIGANIVTKLLNITSVAANFIGSSSSPPLSGNNIPVWKRLGR